MKTNIYILIIAIGFGFVSCKKEIIQKPNTSPAESAATVINEEVTFPVDAEKINIKINQLKELREIPIVHPGEDPNPGDTTGDGGGDDW